MAVSTVELERLLLRYLNGDSVSDRLRLRQMLQVNSVEVRYRALMRVQSEYHWTAVHRGASRCDVESMKYMMAGFTSDQRYNVLSVQSDYQRTALHTTAYYNGDTAIVMYLLSNLSIQQSYNLLKLQNYDGDTALHVSAENKHKGVLQAMLSSVSPEQQKKLLNIKNNNNKIIADIISSAELFNIITVFELQEKLERNEKQTEKIGGELEQLKKNSQDKDRQFTELVAELRDKVTTSEQEIRQLKRKMKELRGQEGENRGEAKKLKLLDEAERRQDSTNQQVATLEERADEYGARIAIAESNNQNTREDLARFSHRVEDLEENAVYREVPIGGHEQPADEFQPMEGEAEAHDR